MQPNTIIDQYISFSLLYCLWDFVPSLCCCQPKPLPIIGRKGLDKEDFSADLQKTQTFLCDLLQESHEVIIHHKEKFIRRTTNSKRRSKYIGVFKNSENWQAFVTIKKKKRYIGTFKTEEGAAQAYDFYSILTCRETAFTNFNYTKSDVFGLMNKYISNGNIYVNDWAL